jgi:L-rhamnose isomerase/sugar isomerase
MTEIYRIDRDRIQECNRQQRKRLDLEFNALATSLKARGVEIGSLVESAQVFAAAVPSWGMATGGTRFGSFPVPGQPRDVFEKIDDAGAVHELTRANPTVSLHIPWDQVDDVAALKRHGRARGLAFDAMNSNTFEDQPGQKHSYQHGSLSHASKAVRDQAIAHNLDCIEIGQKLGSKALSIWIADG